VLQEQRAQQDLLEAHHLLLQLDLLHTEQELQLLLYLQALQNLKFLLLGVEVEVIQMVMEQVVEMQGLSLVSLVLHLVSH
jgi:hypothetical protein